MIFSAIFSKKDHGSVVVASVVSMLSCHRVYAKLTVYVCRCIFGPYVCTQWAKIHQVFLFMIFLFHGLCKGLFLASAGHCFGYSALNIQMNLCV
jgi:hypothetical protein